MKEKIYKKIEYCLYNYKNIDNIIEVIRNNIIKCIDISEDEWLRSKKKEANTVENVAIRIAENKTIIDLKKIKIIILHYMKVFKEKKPKIYKFIKLKYFENVTSIEITKKLNYNITQQNDITDMVVSFFYKQFKKAGVGGI